MSGLINLQPVRFFDIPSDVAASPAVRAGTKVFKSLSRLIICTLLIFATCNFVFGQPCESTNKEYVQKSPGPFTLEIDDN